MNDRQLVKLMREHAIVLPRITLQEARRAGLELAVACGVLEHESLGGRTCSGTTRRSSRAPAPHSNLEACPTRLVERDPGKDDPVLSHQLHQLPVVHRARLLLGVP
jgi:hypothetical protein